MFITLRFTAVEDHVVGKLRNVLELRARIYFGPFRTLGTLRHVLAILFLPVSLTKACQEVTCL